MRYEEPSKRSQILKLIGWTALGIFILISAVIAWAIWPHNITQVSDFIELHPQGMLIIRPNPNDPQFAQLTQQLVAELAPNNTREARWVADLLPKAILPEIVILSFYDKTSKRETMAGALQLRKFGGVLMMCLHTIASNHPDLEVLPGGAVKLVRRSWDAPLAFIQREGLIVSTHEDAARDISNLLALGKKTTKRGPPDSEDRDMVKKMFTVAEDIQAYAVNEPSRFANFLKVGVKNGWIGHEDAELFTDDVLKAIEDNVLGIAMGGKLTPDGGMKTKIKIPLRSVDKAELFKTMLDKNVISPMRKRYYKTSLSVSREDTVVVIEGQIADIQGEVIGPLLQGALAK
jgi:hypothetical protein